MKMIKSRMEKRFMTSTLYKRSKQYMDIHRINRIQQEEELFRRMPTEGSKELVEQKFEESFFSTSNTLKRRVRKDIGKCQQKVYRDDFEETEASLTPQHRRGKTLDMSKMLSRRYFERDSNVRDESQFCNFKPYRTSYNHTVDFEKFVVYSRQQERALHKNKDSTGCSRCKSREHMGSKTQPEDSDYIGKIHNNLIFNNATMQTYTNYKKYDLQKQQQNQEKSPKRDLQKIYIGEQLTRKRSKIGMCEFYHGTNKWVAPQMDNRLSKHNEYFLREQNRKDQSQKDWTIVKRKSDLVDKRKQEILARKKIPDVKGQICDHLYFTRNKI